MESTMKRLGMDEGRSRFETLVEREESEDGGEMRVAGESVKNI